MRSPSGDAFCSQFSCKQEWVSRPSKHQVHRENCTVGPTLQNLAADISVWTFGLWFGRTISVAAPQHLRLFPQTWLFSSYLLHLELMLHTAGIKSLSYAHHVQTPALAAGHPPRGMCTADEFTPDKCLQA